MHYNINASIISDKQIRKRTKLFRRSVQSIERQVLSTDLRGYRGEFLIWSWGLKNKILFSINFLTNFGLTSNTKSCVFFNSEYMLRLLLVPSFSEKIKSKSLFIEVHYSLPRISHSSLVERPNTGIPHYACVVNNCWYETNKIYESNLSLSISVKLNGMLIDASVIFKAFVGCLKRLFGNNFFLAAVVEKSNFVKRRWQGEELFWNKRDIGNGFRT